jgi:hypothetical protein
MLDPGTKGGALVVTSLLCVIPVLAYNILLAAGFEDTVAGPLASGSFVVISIVLWTVRKKTRFLCIILPKGLSSVAQHL